MCRPLPGGGVLAFANTSFKTAPPPPPSSGKASTDFCPGAKAGRPMVMVCKGVVTDMPVPDAAFVMWRAASLQGRLDDWISTAGSRHIPQRGGYCGARQCMMDQSAMEGPQRPPPSPWSSGAIQCRAQRRLTLLGSVAGRATHWQRPGTGNIIRTLAFSWRTPESSLTAAANRRHIRSSR